MCVCLCAVCIHRDSIEHCTAFLILFNVHQIRGKWSGGVCTGGVDGGRWGGEGLALHILIMPSYFNQPCLLLDLLEASVDQENFLNQAFQDAGGIVLITVLLTHYCM